MCACNHICITIHWSFNSRMFIHPDFSIQNGNVSLPPVMEDQGSFCQLACSFNNNTSPTSLPSIGEIAPCLYTIDIINVFKGNPLVSIRVCIIIQLFDIISIVLQINIMMKPIATPLPSM